jgi:DNA helicase-2/ATP-dependent DNA helicase PcrA
MATRLAAPLQARLRFGTFHSLCLQQLTDVGMAGRILNNTEIRHYVARAMEQLGVVEELDAMEGWIADVKVGSLSTAIPRAAVEVARRYDELLARDGAIDFNDMMVRCVSLMRAGTIPPLSVQHMLIDEFQDIDRVQMDWVKHHLASGTKVFAVGDDDQSIYGFRRALGYAGMMELVGCADAAVMALERNYRSTAGIVSCCARMIGHNLSRVAKNHRAVRGEGPAPILTLYKVREEQYDHVVTEIRQLCAGNRTPPLPKANPDALGHAEVCVRPGQIAVLARANHNLWPMEKALREAGIPCIRLGRKSIWEEPALEVLASILTSLIRKDALGLRVALRWAGVEDEHIQEGCDGYQVSNGGATADAPSVGAEQLLGLARDWARQLAGKDASNAVLSSVCDWMLGVIAARLQTCPAGVRSSLERDTQLVLDARETLLRLSGTLTARLWHAKNDSRKDDARVALCTFHGAKGLEWESVFLLDVNQGLCPSKESMTDEELIEEERRILYVAMTRAKNRLEILAHRDKPSEFLVDAGLLKAAVSACEEEEKHEHVTAQI